MAYHEAGHALLGLIEPQADHPVTASISETGRSYGPAPSDPQRERRLPGERYRRGRITGLLGGLAAERVIYGDQARCDGPDQAEALAAARQLVSAVNVAATQAFTTLVPPVGEIPPLEAGCLQGGDGALPEREAQRVLGECFAEAQTVLRRHQDELVALALALHSKPTLELAEVREALTAAGGVSKPAPGAIATHKPTRRRRQLRLVGSAMGTRRLAREGARRALTRLWPVPGGLGMPMLVLDPAMAAPPALGHTAPPEFTAPPGHTAPPAPPRERAEPGALPAERAASKGPAAELAPVRHTSEEVLTGVALLRYWGVAAIWVVVTVAFWTWWLRHSAHATAWLYWTQTIMLFYQTTLLPTVYWGFVRKMRRPVELQAPDGLRVALITLCVPAQESASVIREQLAALVGVSYPHDSWILDEGNSPEVRTLAAEWGVRYFSRRGVALWNQADPPFQRSTKAGNVNAWLDHVASLDLNYDVFVQLDIDHRPRADYLDRTLGYFRDPAVAWVQAPSVCGNLDNWAARGLSEQDLVFHGPLQMAFYGASRTPFIIGSHTTYRMDAIRGIGGFQPTRAEDHLDTVVLAAHGYEGVFVPELIAVGQGPEGLGTYLRQQFAWAYSMIQIFLQHTPGLVRRYSLRQAFQFLFCQSWYTLWSISLAVLWVLPTVALLSHRSIAAVKVGDFLIYFAPVLLVSSLMWSETRRWFQPAGVRLSWRGIVLTVARWPVVLWALLNVIFGIKRSYMITPKGQKQHAGNGAVIYGPGLALAAVPLLALWAFYASAGSGAVQGYYGLALLNAAMGLVVVATTVLAEIGVLGRDHGFVWALRSRGGVMLSAGALGVLLVFSTVTVWSPMVGAIS